MQPTTGQVIEQALLLSEKQQLEVVEQLVQSLARSVAPDVEAAWLAEAERRRRAVLNGETTAIPGEEVLTRLRAKYGC